MIAATAPAGIANIDDKIICKTLCNVQKLEISNIVKPIALKTDSCLCCSINAFCDMIDKMTKLIPKEKPIIMYKNTLMESKIPRKSFANEAVKTVKH